MVKKAAILTIILTMFLSVSCLAGEKLDTYMPKFDKCIEKLGANFKIDPVNKTYAIEMNYRALLGYMEDLDEQSILMVASIAIEWGWDVEFPKYEQLATKDGRMQLAKAIQSAHAKAILKAAESILSKDKVWL